MRVRGGASIGLASMWLLAMTPADAHTNGGLLSAWWARVSGGHGNGHHQGGNNHGGHHHGGYPQHHHHYPHHHGGHGHGGHGGGHGHGHGGHGHGGGHHGGGGNGGGGNGCTPAATSSTWAGGQCTSNTGNTSSWSNSTNWSGGRAPSGPTAVAEFGASPVTTVNFDTTATLGTLLFNASAPAYTFNIAAPYTMTLADAGVRNLSSFAPTFNVAGKLAFINGASAGNAALVGSAGGIIDFSGVTSGVPTAGSLGGAGTVYLGRNTLAIGGLNANTTFSGSILEGTVRGGSLRKTGTGTFTLTGLNNWSGGTFVAGQLAVTGGGRIEGTSGVTIADLASDTGSLRIAGAQSRVTSAGSVIVGNAGRGTLTLEDGGTLSATSVLLGSGAGSTGTLNIGSGGVAGVLTATSVVAGSGTGSAVTINQSQPSYTLSSNLLGALALNHNGTGTTTLTGTNSYSGGTFLNAGALRISANTQLGGATNVLNFNGGALQASATITNFTHPVVLGSRGGTMDTGTFSVTTTGALSGTGRLTKSGSGTLTLNGTSTYTGGTTVSAGSLRGTTASLSGSILNNASVSFLQTTDGTYSGVMSGSGTLTKLNAGSLTLSGANTFTGGTTISSGSLIVTGSLASAVNLGESGTLGGTGTIRAPVAVSGVLAPGVGGTGIGTLTVADRVTFNSGSVYRVDADSSGRADRLDASGAVTINDATVEVVANPSGTWDARKTYTIITAGGSGVAGQFADVTTDLAFLTPSLSYRRNDVTLTLERNDTTFGSVTRTRKQADTATYLQALSVRTANDATTSAVLESVTESSAQQARLTFDQLSGSDLTRASRVASTNTARVVDVLVSRLARSSAENQGIWMDSVTASAEEVIREDGTAASTSRYGWRSNGVVTGFDARIGEQTLLGVSLSHTRSDVLLNGRGDASAEVQAPRAMFYATTESGPLQLSGVAGFSRPDYRTQRRMPYLGTALATASHAANEVSTYFEAASSRSESGLLQPLAAVRYIRSSEASYVESGNAGGLAIQARTAHVLTSELGTRYFRELSGQDGSIELRAAWSRSYADTFSNVAARLSSDVGGEAFATSDGGTARDHLLMDMKIVALLPNQFSLRMDCSVDAPLGGPLRSQLGIRLERAW